MALGGSFVSIRRAGPSFAAAAGEAAAGRVESSSRVLSPNTANTVSIP